MNHKLNCILLVDDDAICNIYNSTIIKDAACTVHIKTEQKAHAALEYIIESGRLMHTTNTLPFPDLILLDLYMPVMDGWDFLREYKKLKNFIFHTPVIVMNSISNSPKDKSTALKIPEVAAFHEKPMTPEIINSIVSKYFPYHI